MLTNTFSIWEIAMLLCFAGSWPFSIYKSLKTKFVLGKSPAFMSIILAGYVFGMLHKIFFHFDIVFLLYVFNFCIVAFDLVLYFIYAPKNRRELSLKDKH